MFFKAVDEQLNIFAGWAEIRDKTDGQCITFRNRTDNDIDYVFVQKGAVGSGCYSEVGKYGGRQVIKNLFYFKILNYLIKLRFR